MNLKKLYASVLAAGLISFGGCNKQEVKPEPIPKKSKNT